MNAQENPFAGLIVPMNDRPCVSRSEQQRKLAVPEWPIAPQPRRRRPWVENPWKLTPGQCEALSAVIEAGSDEDAGKLLGISSRTVAMQITRAKDRLGMEKRLHVLLAYDRWVRAHRGEA